MTERNSEYWNKVRRARDKLAESYLDHPDVSLIDIGFPPEKQKDSQMNMVLRVHVREQWFKLTAEKRSPFPSEIDGLPVVIMRGDYKLD